MVRMTKTPKDHRRRERLRCILWIGIYAATDFGRILFRFFHALAWHTYLVKKKERM